MSEIRNFVNKWLGKNYPREDGWGDGSCFDKTLAKRLVAAVAGEFKYTIIWPDEELTEPGLTIIQMITLIQEEVDALSL